MIDVVIHAHNELYSRLQCDPGVAYEISEEFSFFVDGYKFMPLYKSGRWDGKIRLFKVKERLFYKGLLPKLVRWLKDSGYTVKIHEPENLQPTVKYHPDWLEQNADRVGKFEPMSHQVTAINKGLGLNQALILSPTGSGKSYITYMMVRFLLENTDQRILITVPTTSLVEQLFTDFEDYVADDWDVAEHCAKLYGGKNKTPDQRVVISTWQSVFRKKAPWFKSFGAYICDEAHQADAKSITGIVDKLGHAPVRVGLTGTLDGTVMHEFEMLGRFGPIIRAASTKTLIENDVLSRLEIVCLRLKYNKADIKYVKGLKYQQEVDFIITHPERNRVLVNAALRQQGNTLMLFNYIKKHGVVLHQMLQEKAARHGKKIYYISGDTPTEEREEIRATLESNTNCILLATFGTLSTGVNIKNLDSILFCHPFKAKIRTLQSIGRTLRKSDGKRKATLVDVADDLVHVTRAGNEKQNATMRHFIERLKIYQDEGFKYNMVNVPLTP